MEENNNKDFEIVEVNHDQDDIIVTDEDFKFAAKDKKIHDQKFETKPTTFLKDSLKRFSKNKSSVVASYILGALILGAIFIPIIDQNDVSVPHPDMVHLTPKLFPSGTGFWDGIKHYDDIAYDRVNQVPSQKDFSSEAVVDNSVKVGPVQYINQHNDFATGGYINFSYDGLKDEQIPEGYVAPSVFFESYKLKKTMDLSYDHFVDVKFGNDYADTSYDKGTFRFYVKFNGGSGSTVLYLTPVMDTTNDIVHLDLNKAIKQAALQDPNVADDISTLYDARFGFELTNDDVKASKCMLIKSVEFSTSATNKAYKDSFTKPNFTDANHMIAIKAKEDNGQFNRDYWASTGNRNLYKAEYQTCSFDYDVYEATFGRKRIVISDKEMKQYVYNQWCDYDFNASDPASTFKVKNKEKCPVLDVYSHEVVGTDIQVINITADVTYYKYIGYSSMPIFLFGTDKSGRDMLKYVFEGLRTSLLLGLLTFIVCFLFGLCWGSISGYFGGNVDLAMERFTDILSGVPWIVVMTLCIIHLGSNFGTFALALCLTGWISIAHLTRTQFYRFKGREYVLASRTLGSSNFRLIFKHILPNAMGTIITSAVLMIPSVIFSEATISYLGLGLQDLASLGVILSDNQSMLLSYPYLLLFPSCIIALIMISFNLFGNGLRDAINPSLKGEGE